MEIQVPHVNIDLRVHPGSLSMVVTGHAGATRTYQLPWPVMFDDVADVVTRHIAEDDVRHDLVLDLESRCGLTDYQDPDDPEGALVLRWLVHSQQLDPRRGDIALAAHEEFPHPTFHDSPPASPVGGTFVAAGAPSPWRVVVQRDGTAVLHPTRPAAVTDGHTAHRRAGRVRVDLNSVTLRSFQRIWSGTELTKRRARRAADLLGSPAVQAADPDERLALWLLSAYDDAAWLRDPQLQDHAFVDEPGDPCALRLDWDAAAGRVAFVWEASLPDRAVLAIACQLSSQTRTDVMLTDALDAAGPARDLLMRAITHAGTGTTPTPLVRRTEV